MATKLHAQTHYKLSFNNLNGHLLEVEARFEGKFGVDETVYMPVWTPGSYLIREYAKNIETVAFTDDNGRPIPVERTSKASWKVTSGGKPFRVRYRLYANELAVRNAHVDASHAFFTPAAVLIYTLTLAEKPHEVEIELPSTWKTISTPLPSTAPNTYTANNLDELMDAPFEMGSHTEQTFMLEGVTYRLATFPANLQFSPKHLDDIRDVVQQANRVFGAEPPPLKEYLFITHLAGGGGGLEHKNSSVLQGSPTALSDAKALQGFLSLVAHEYFHLWNVKRIRPYRLGPFDYQQENYTHTLWFAEGITSYYDDLLTARAGKMTREEYLNILSTNINNAGSQLGRNVQSLEDASFEAWIKYYRPNENSVNATVSYYTAGGVVGWAMDMHIRNLTKGAKSLDDVMQHLWQSAKGNANFYADRMAITAALSAVCGADQTDWLAGLVAQPGFPNIEKLALGVGFLPVDRKLERFWPTLGIGQQRQGDRIVASFIARNSPAEKAGIYTGDVLVKLNGNPLTEPYKEDDLPYSQGQTVTLDILRQGQSKSFTLAVEASTRMRWQMGIVGKPSQYLKTWLAKH